MAQLILSYKLVGASGGYTPLFDETAGDIATPEINPEFKPTNMEELLFGSPTKFRAPLGNTSVRHTFTFRRQYSGATAGPDCLHSVVTMYALVGVLMHLQLTKGAEVQYYPNALVESYQPVNMKDVSVEHKFAFASDPVTNTAP